MKSFEVAVLGASGSVGKELVEILSGHPNVSTVNTPPRDELPEFEGSDVVFSALPHGESANEVTRFRDEGSTVIDLSGDLRFPNPGSYEKWYRRLHPAPHLLTQKIPYGLPELNRGALEPGRKLVSMPGCYPTAALLALVPLKQRAMINAGEMITVTADSGYSGRGKNADNSDLIDDNGRGYNVTPYKTGREHQHVGEMEQWLGDASVFFSPNVLPIERGMLVKAATKLAFGVSPAAVREVFEEAYAEEPFVAVLPEESIPDITETARTDECHIGFVVVKQCILVGSSIDNLRKGAGSQAVQVFNRISSLPEETGLRPKAGWPPPIKK
jgi:N-acetyl-gamma-glutamyl-phosphate reductase